MNNDGQIRRIKHTKNLGKEGKKKKKENAWRRRFYPIVLALSRPLRMIEKNIESIMSCNCFSPLAILVSDHHVLGISITHGNQIA